MKKTIKNNKRILIILGVIIILLAAWFIFNEYSQAQDKARFQQAEAVKAQVASELVAYLGDNVTSVSEKNECFNTEQGPFDNGRLWCQATTSIILGSDTEYEELGNKVFLSIENNSIAERQEGSSTILPTFSLKLNNGIVCNLLAASKSGEQYGTAMSKRSIVNEVPVVAVACSDRAKAKHYPYSE